MSRAKKSSRVHRSLPSQGRATSSSTTMTSSSLRNGTSPSLDLRPNDCTTPRRLPNLPVSGGITVEEPAVDLVNKLVMTMVEKILRETVIRYHRKGHAIVPADVMRGALLSGYPGNLPERLIEHNLHVLESHQVERRTKKRKTL